MSQVHLGFQEPVVKVKYAMVNANVINDRLARTAFLGPYLSNVKTRIWLNPSCKSNTPLQLEDGHPVAAEIRIKSSGKHSIDGLISVGISIKLFTSTVNSQSRSTVVKRGIDKLNP